MPLSDWFAARLEPLVVKVRARKPVFAPLSTPRPQSPVTSLGHLPRSRHCPADGVSVLNAFAVLAVDTPCYQNDDTGHSALHSTSLLLLQVPVTDRCASARAPARFGDLGEALGLAVPPVVSAPWA